MAAPEGKFTNRIEVGINIFDMFLSPQSHAHAIKNYYGNQLVFEVRREEGFDRFNYLNIDGYLVRNAQAYVGSLIIL